MSLSKHLTPPDPDPRPFWVYYWESSDMFYTPCLYKDVAFYGDSSRSLKERILSDLGRDALHSRVLTLSYSDLCDEDLSVLVTLLREGFIFTFFGSLRPDTSDLEAYI